MILWGRLCHPLLPVWWHVFYGSESKHSDKEKHQQLQCSSDTVGDEVADTNENGTRDDDALYDGRQALCLCCVGSCCGVRIGTGKKWQEKGWM